MDTGPDESNLFFKDDDMTLKKCILPPLASLLLFINPLIADEDLPDSATSWPQLRPHLPGYTLPVNSHWLVSIDENYRCIEIEDGSHWDIPSEQAHLLRNWRKEDVLVISPNYTWLSSYDYCITHTATDSHVKANLLIGPLPFGPQSHWIANIDHSTGHIYLENQMIWCVNPDDRDILKYWEVNQPVIFGVSKSWLTSYDHVLINSDTDDHVRVRQY